MEHVFKLDKSATEPDILLWKLESDVFDVLFCYEEINVGTNCLCVSGSGAEGVVSC